MPGTRTRRRVLRHGLPAAAEPPGCRRCGRAAADRARQARRRHRRRRYRVRLRRHVEPPGCAVGHPVRVAGTAAGAREQAPRLALLADEVAHVVVARGRLRTRLGGPDQGVQGRAWQAEGARCLSRRVEEMASSSRFPPANSRSRPIWSCWRWVTCIPCIAACSTSSAVKYDARGNVAADTDSYLTSKPKVFAAGDTRRGQSLVVWAIREGRQCARAIDEFLNGASDLPRRDLCVATTRGLGRGSLVRAGAAPR